MLRAATTVPLRRAQHLLSAPEHTPCNATHAEQLPSKCHPFPQVYVYAIVGRDFYKQFRVWIISFTKVVFAMHPPGEHLHLAALASETVGAAVPAWRLLLTLANGMRLPYMVLTGLGWGTFAFNIPLQVTTRMRLFTCIHHTTCMGCIALRQMDARLQRLPTSQLPSPMPLRWLTRSWRLWDAPSRTTRPSAPQRSSAHPRQAAASAGWELRVEGAWLAGRPAALLFPAILLPTACPAEPLLPCQLPSLSCCRPRPCCTAWLTA